MLPEVPILDMVSLNVSSACQHFTSKFLRGSKKKHPVGRKLTCCSLSEICIEEFHEYNDQNYTSDLLRVDDGGLGLGFW